MVLKIVNLLGATHAKTPRRPAQDLNLEASMSMDEDPWSALSPDRGSDFRAAFHALWVALTR